MLQLDPWSRAAECDRRSSALPTLSGAWFSKNSKHMGRALQRVIAPRRSGPRRPVLTGGADPYGTDRGDSNSDALSSPWTYLATMGGASIPVAALREPCEASIRPR